MKVYSTISLIISLIFVFSACNVKKLGVKAMVPTLKDVSASMYQQGDYELMKDGLPGQILLVDGMISIAPDNRDLLVIGAQAYCGYTMGFVEDFDPQRASELYAKGKEYGYRALLSHKKFRKAIEKGVPLWDAVKLIEDDEKDFAPALFWTAMCWASWLNFNMTDPSAMLGIPGMRAIIDKLYKIDDKYFYGGVHLLLGAYYSQIPALMGGGIEKSKEEFQKAFEISEGKMLLQNVYYARYVATALQDEELFVSELQKVLSAPMDILPEQKFTTTIAKKKAEYLLRNKDKFF